LLAAIGLAVALFGTAACSGQGMAADAGNAKSASGSTAFTAYRDAGDGYRLEYPTDFEVEDGSDGRTMQGPNTRLRLFDTALDGHSLRALAASEIADPSAASEIQNSEGSVVLVQESAATTRTVKTIALEGVHAAVLVIDASPAQSDLRRRILDSFKPVSPRAKDEHETDADRRYRNPELGFSIERPQGARVSRDGAESVSFAVLGPANEAASEISDGFTVSVVRDADMHAETLGEYAEAVRADGAPSADRLRIGDNEALRYSSRSEFGGRVMHWLFMPPGGAHYRVTTTISGPQRDYPSQIQAMLESLRFD
jgi:hypothetical protein